MNLIDPFEFREMFRDTRSIAVVGSAPTIVNHDNGALIDSHDMVVRFNRARTDGVEAAVGRRTDVLVVNAKNTLGRSPAPAELCRPRCLLCFFSPAGPRMRDLAPFREWVGTTPIVMTFWPDLIGLPLVDRTRPLTSGTYALYTLLQMFELEKLFVTGFTMFGAVAGGAGNIWADDLPNAGSSHDLDEEARLFATILGDFRGELKVTDEIRALCSRNGIDLDERLVTGGVTSPTSARRRLAQGLAWRMLRLGMKLRRVAEG